MATLADIRAVADLINMDDDFLGELVEKKFAYPHLDDLSQEQLILRMGEAEAAIREETCVLNACLERLQERARSWRNV